VTARLALSVQTEDLVDAFAAALTDADAAAWASAIGGPGPSAPDTPLPRRFPRLRSRNNYAFLLTSAASRRG
jgi:hypothetical protein